jgi:hypothetical protein
VHINSGLELVLVDLLMHRANLPPWREQEFVLVVAMLQCPERGLFKK